MDDRGEVAFGAMLMIALALTEAAEVATDYDAEFGPIAWSLVGAALLYTAVATWIVTPKGEPHH